MNLAAFATPLAIGGVIVLSLADLIIRRDPAMLMPVVTGLFALAQVRPTPPAPPAAG
jgi:hypothetical protein